VNVLLLSAICAPIRPSVTLSQMVQHIEMSFPPCDRAMLDAPFLSSS